MIPITLTNSVVLATTARVCGDPRYENLGC